MKTLTPTDVHALINLAQKEMQGLTPITVVDTSSFISAGEQMLACGTENVINALSLVLGRTIVASRPYDAKFKLINSLDSGAYANRIRKISFYSKDAKADGWHNTNLYTNLKSGYTNGQNITDGTPASVRSMWEQNAPEVLEMNYGGSDVWQYVTTMYENQLKVAFRSENEFSQFIAGILTEAGNDIEQEKEAFARLTVLNHMAGAIDLGLGVDLVSAYNSRYGTEYTGEQLRTTQLNKFLPFFVETMKLTSDRLTHRTGAFHVSPNKKDASGEDLVLLRHTPKRKQRALLYNPLFIQAEAQVLPEIFNDNYLKIEQGERVDYWQSFETPAAINVTPGILNIENPAAGQIAGETVSIPYVVGMIFDEDAIMADFQLEEVHTTPLEARKGFRNVWYTFAKNPINDFTENTVVFYMAN